MGVAHNRTGDGFRGSAKIADTLVFAATKRGPALARYGSSRDVDK